MIRSTNATWRPADIAERHARLNTPATIHATSEAIWAGILANPGVKWEAAPFDAPEPECLSDVECDARADREQRWRGVGVR